MMPHHRLHQFAFVVAIGCACASNSSWAQEEHDLAKQLAAGAPREQPVAGMLPENFEHELDASLKALFGR